MPNLSEKILNLTSKVGITFPTHVPIYNNAPNPERLQSWADSQTTPKLRDLAHTIIANFSYVSFQEFLQNLKTVVDEFNQMLGDEPYVLLIGEHRELKLRSGCSDLWVIGLAFEYCNLKEPVDIINLCNLSEYLEKNKIENVLMLDDAAYSAAQKGNSLKQFTSGLRALDINFYLGMPFMTKYAKEKLQFHACNFREFRLINAAELEVVTDVLDKNQYDYAKSAGLNYIDSKHTLTYFEHKFPDFFSTYQEVYFGYNILGAIQKTNLMHFSGYTCEKDIAKKLNITYIEVYFDWDKIFSKMLEPNVKRSMHGYAIPHIIPPYNLHRSLYREKLEEFIRAGRMGKKNSNYFAYPEVEQIIAETVSQEDEEGFLRPEVPLAVQIEFDRALLGGYSDIATYTDITKHRSLLAALGQELTFLKRENSINPEKYLNFQARILGLYSSLDDLRNLVKGKIWGEGLHNYLRSFSKNNLTKSAARYKSFSVNFKNTLALQYPFIDSTSKQILANILLCLTVIGAFLLLVRQVYSLIFENKFSLFFNDGPIKAKHINALKDKIDTMQLDFV